MQVKVYDITAKEVGKLTLADSVFKVPYNEAWTPGHKEHFNPYRS